MSLSAARDAYGRLLLDAFEGRSVVEVVERDDGFLMGSPGAPANYFAPFQRWPAHQRRAMRFVRGRVLDVGCGAGRVALHLQDRGQEVVAIDNSPLAIEVAHRRGVRDARLLSVGDVDAKLGVFDTVAMFGNNFGLFANPRRAQRLLRRFESLTPPGRGRIVAEVLDPYATDDPDPPRLPRAQSSAWAAPRTDTHASQTSRGRDTVVRLPLPRPARTRTAAQRHRLDTRSHYPVLGRPLHGRPRAKLTTTDLERA